MFCWRTNRPPDHLDYFCSKDLGKDSLHGLHNLFNATLYLSGYDSSFVIRLQLRPLPGFWYWSHWACIVWYLSVQLHKPFESPLT